MIRKIVFRPRAVADLDAMWAYTVETWSETQATTYLTGLDVALQLLADFPDMARVRQEFSPPVRIHPYQKHLIVFLADDTKIDVVRITHSRANWSEFLAE